MGEGAGDVFARGLTSGTRSPNIAVPLPRIVSHIERHRESNLVVIIGAFGSQFLSPFPPFIRVSPFFSFAIKEEKERKKKGTNGRISPESC